MYSPIAEFLLAQRRPRGGTLCHTDRMQLNIEGLAPGFDLDLVLLPPQSAYAGLKYMSSYASSTLPDALYQETTCEGVMYGVGTVTSDWTREYMPFWVIYTQKSPINIKFRVISRLAQRVEGTQWNILFNSEADFEEAMQLVREYSKRMGKQFLEETMQLLREVEQRGLR